MDNITEIKIFNLFEIIVINIIKNLCKIESNMQISDGIMILSNLLISTVSRLVKCDNSVDRRGNFALNLLT